ncbi:hypothetical protein [Burkholderia pseudomallei]|nr:hypothetical protein [Burkholderia pseudomallei]KGS39310.1 hypothetical protein X945_4646 [Burkholderia pseudomallei ABCPW 107]MBD2911737.1 hypothetical protein [Burkholderia pseudomallei]MBD2923716.1 hypothetical protein [Burkholderia pseudomallei]MBD2929862.1 hypothetical protein [Burkholderia pseudomallei]MBD2966744.1 hypothetical protein [Burkholderia pseudomallei]
MRIKYSSVIALLASMTAASQQAPTGMAIDNSNSPPPHINWARNNANSGYKGSEFGSIGVPAQAPGLAGGDGPTIVCNDAPLKKRILDLEKYVQLLQTKISILESYTKENGK